MKLEIEPTLIPRYIAVEGPIGVGKTSLVKRLAQSFNYETVLEAPEANPFLSKFYENRRQVALQTQLFFLFDRVRQLEVLRQHDLFEPVRVADFLLEKDRLFAELNLDREELILYNKIVEHLSVDVPRPDLVVYLQAPVSVLQDRIRNRGIDYEQVIDAEYLQSLTEAYARFFHFYDKTPLLIVNTEEIDLVGNDRDYEEFVQFLLSLKHGRHYYNPRPSMI